MESSRVSSKGQITIPKYVRDSLGIDAGDRVVFVNEDGRMVIKKAALVALEDKSEEGLSWPR